jgi:hypothetical protein
MTTLFRVYEYLFCLFAPPTHMPYLIFHVWTLIWSFAVVCNSIFLFPLVCCISLVDLSPSRSFVCQIYFSDGTVRWSLNGFNILKMKCTPSIHFQLSFCLWMGELKYMWKSWNAQIMKDRSKDILRRYIERCVGNGEW